MDIFDIISLASLSMIPFVWFSSVLCKVGNILKEKVLNSKTFGSSFWKFLSGGLTWDNLRPDVSNPILTNQHLAYAESRNENFVNRIVVQLVCDCLGLLHFSTGNTPSL